MVESALAVDTDMLLFKPRENMEDSAMLGRGLVETAVDEETDKDDS